MFKPEVRIVGRASEEEKTKIKSDLAGALFEHFESLSPAEREELKSLEQPKTEKELAMIDFANQETNKLLEEFGLEPYNIPVDNYHLVPPDSFRKIIGKNVEAATSYVRQGIFFPTQHYQNNPINFGAAAFHETMHLKVHLAVVTREGGRIFHQRGVEVSGQKSGQHIHFRGLHEAIVSIQEKKMMDKVLDLPILKEEKDWLSSDEAQKKIKEAASRRGVPKDDIYWVEKNGDVCGCISYLKQRQTLDYVCREIQKQLPDKYKNDEEVFREFLRAHFTGQLLPIARLVEKTFGEGSFRLLGNMTEDQPGAALILESMKKIRARYLREKKGEQEQEKATV